MAITEKGNELLKSVQKLLDEKGDNSTISMEELVDASGLSLASVRGRMGKLIKEGYMISDPVEIDGKKKKRISLSDLGWEHDCDAWEPASAE